MIPMLPLTPAAGLGYCIGVGLLLIAGLCWLLYKGVILGYRQLLNVSCRLYHWTKGKAAFYSSILRDRRLRKHCRLLQ